jgi:hypothetical protein
MLEQNYAFAEICLESLTYVEEENTITYNIY